MRSKVYCLQSSRDHLQRLNFDEHPQDCLKPLITETGSCRKKLQILLAYRLEGVKSFFYYITYLSIQLSKVGYRQLIEKNSDFSQRKRKLSRNSKSCVNVNFTILKLRTWNLKHLAATLTLYVKIFKNIHLTLISAKKKQARQKFSFVTVSRYRETTIFILRKKREKG